MIRSRFGSVRLRTTVAATAVTAVVLVIASILIVRLVERDLESNARAALSDALESASHAASGEESESGESNGTDGESVGDVQQRQIADASIREVEAGVDAASDALTVIVPVVVVLLGGAIWLTVGRALRPVHDISSQVAAISGSTLDERVPEPDSGDEIAELAALMNEMLDRLQAASERQRQFVADASHELKSPLSTVVAAAEIAEVSPDPQRLQGLATTIGTEARRMQALVTDLLDLARLDEQRHDRDLTAVDLAVVCTSVAERFDADRLELDVVATGPVEVIGVESQLERAVLNVVDNATNHAERRVRITARASATTREVHVEDDGPGIPAVERERVFDRFVRLDEARSRDSGGTGLGLSLVRAVVERHGGSVEIDCSPELGGTRVCITIPKDDGRSVAERVGATRSSTIET